MSSNRPSLWHGIIGVGFVVAGISKLIAVKPQEKLFTSWGWTRKDMQVMGASELFGGALIITGSTQRLGAALLSASSLCLLIAELKHNNRLVTPRLAMLAAAATGFFKLG